MDRVEAVVIGEALIDVIRREGATEVERPGGSPANVALGLARLGRRVRLLTALGDDAHGAALRAWLHAAGVEVEAHRLERTATAVARLDAQGAAAYTFDLEWDLGALPVTGAPSVVHVGSLSALREPGAERVRTLVEGLPVGVVVAYDPNVRPSLIPPVEQSRPRVEAWVRRSHIVKVSDDDLAWLYPGVAAGEIVERWSELGPQVVVLTKGGQGIDLVRPGEPVRSYAAPPVTVSDTVGAGDSLMAALVEAVLEHPVADWDLDAVAARALRIAAITVSRPGADPPNRAELAGEAESG